MSKYFLLAAALFVVGCSEQSPSPLQVYRGEQRIKLFKECMELAAKNTRKGDDDVSDIVSACSSQSWYLAQSIEAVPNGGGK